jgi:L-asparaginase
VLWLCAALAGAAERQPRVVILTTGGTIAGTADPRSAVGYNAATLGAAQLVAAVPGLDSLATLSSEAIAQIGSQNVTDEIWIKLARRISELFDSGAADGVVITHGTDTLEETAFFLDLVLPGDRPVVLVGAMRPSTALGADGPANLYQAVKVAATPAARGRGVLVVLNGTIHDARGVQKTDTSALDTFRTPLAGPVGYVDAAQVRFVSAVAARGARFALPASDSLPRVDIVYAHAQMDGGAIDDAVKRGARGIVIAGVGAGNSSDPAMAAIARAVAANIIVVRASRVGNGFVDRNVEVDDDKLGLVAALDLNPQKARILLRLALANGLTDPTKIQAAFAANAN